MSEIHWFGYILNGLGYVNYGLLIDFRLVAANDNEYPHSEALLERLVHSKLAMCCETIVVDRGLDNDGVRKKLHKRSILALIETRKFWVAGNLDGSTEGGDAAAESGSL